MGISHIPIKPTSQGASSRYATLLSLYLFFIKIVTSVF